MKLTRRLGFLMMIGILASCTACGSETTPVPVEESIQEETDNSVSSSEETPVSESEENSDTQELKLDHTYVTQFGTVNAVSYPCFLFDYPGNWTVVNEEVSEYSERVVLENATGITVTFWHFGEMRDLTGATRSINDVDVTKVGDASFIPGYIQATDYSDLGKFMVAKLKTTCETDMLSGESMDMEDGPVRYALLPESEIGIQYESIIVGLPTFSFWYGGHISLIADSPSGKFSEQEEKEVIAIISSFRDEDGGEKDTSVVPESVGVTGSHSAASIEELWSMLKGEWVFEEYVYGEKKTKYADHTLTFRYVDNLPCLSREYHGENTQDVNTFFYDIASISEFSYDLYNYKRGSYGGEGDNWSDDVRLVWYNFDLSNISNGKLILTYHIALDNGFVDNHRFTYSKVD